MEILDVIHSRTSYRNSYENTQIPKEDLVKIMEAGLAAPSGSNKQTTSLIAVDDPKLLANLYQITHPAISGTAPAMICVLTQEIKAHEGRLFNVQDYSATIENMLLTIVSLGYQSCWYEGQVTDADHIGQKMADLLGVPEDYQLVCFLPVGIANQPLKFAKKKPFEERAWFNGFYKSSENLSNSIVKKG